MRNPRRHKYYITMNNYLDLSGVSEKITSGVRKKHRLSMLGLKPPLEDSSGSRSGLCAVEAVSVVCTQDVQTRHSSYELFILIFGGGLGIYEHEQEEFYNVC